MPLLVKAHLYLAEHWAHAKISMEASLTYKPCMSALMEDLPDLI